jgi:hypothetical protein
VCLQVLMVNEFKGGTYDFGAKGTGTSTTITGETWLSNFGVPDLDVRGHGMVFLFVWSVVLLVATYASLSLRKYVK